MAFPHTLGEYVALLKTQGLFLRAGEADLSRPVEGLTYDDREAGEGTLFICKGAAFREQYLVNAYNKGAFAYVSEREYPSLPGGIIVNDVRKAMAYLARLFTSYDPASLKTVAITGTKGKSTTAFFVKSVLDTASGGKCGIVSTILNSDGVTSAEAELSTPESVKLYKHFAAARESGLEYFVTETSSQALKYDRVLGMTFDVGCFTNLGRDHISRTEHPDMEDYFASKLKLFEHCRTACVFSGSERFEEICAAARKNCETVLTYGFLPNDGVYCAKSELLPDGARFAVKTKELEDEFEISMRGAFNIENALAAVACSVSLGISAEDIKRGLKSARVPGRMEHFASEDGELNVIVDYAHNGMSLEALLGSVSREYPGIPIISVFGSAGGKAPERRAEMGKVSAKYSALTVITEDDEANEPLEDICAEIAQSVRENGGEYIIIPDREEAVRTAITQTEGKKTVVLAGKGRETHQRRAEGSVKVPTDVELALKYISLYDAEKKAAKV